MSATDSIHDLAEEVLLETAFGIEPPICHEGLSFVPIVKKGPRSSERIYVNASEALSVGVLQIIEAGDSVNTIIARSAGSLPILIEESEVLVASGSQDRMVIASVLLQPGEERRIPVKCVHAPAGLRRGAGFQSIGAALPSMKARFRQNKYCAIMTDVEHYCAEEAVDQTEVWDEVQRCCKTIGVQDPTEYTEALKRIEERTRLISTKIREGLPKETCGVVVVDSGGRAIAVEIYRAEQAFWKRTGLIESLVMEHAITGGTPVARESSWSAAVQLFFDLRSITQEQAICKEGSGNIIIAINELRGEAVTESCLKGTPKVLYCSLGI